MAMAVIKKLVRRYQIVLVGLIILFAHLAVFWQFYFKGLLPFPGDLLVSFFFPWNSGGFAGYNSWTTHKAVIAADVIRQMYPWKVFAFEQIRNFRWPLWDPYNFSGYPLIADLQSSIFFPGNVLFLCLPTLKAWIALVISLPFLLTVFTYLFFRSLKLSRPAAVFGGIAMANIGYLVVWHEQLIISQVVLFLPLILWVVNQYSNKRRLIYLLFLPLLFAFAIFGGHAQTYIYLLIIAVPYMFLRKLTLREIAFCLGCGFLIGAIQLLPTLEIYLHSAREGEATRQLFAPFILPWSNLITILAPDFFGNPASGNFWGKQYGDFQVYFGVVAFVFTLIGAVRSLAVKEMKLFFILGVVGLLFALAPLVYLPHLLRIPILATGVPARSLFIFQFSAVVLAAYGFHCWWTEQKTDRNIIFPIAAVGLAYLLLWVVVLGHHTWEFRIARNNLLLPSATFVITALAFLAVKIRRKIIWLSAGVLTTLAVLEYAYFFNKYQPFAPEKFVFPHHPVTNFLQQKAGLDRFYGFGTAYIDNNFTTYFAVYSPEGWDSLYIKRYGELLASAADGKFPRSVLRSDAVFPSQDNAYRNRLFDLLGVKYILDKNDFPQSNWEPETAKFSPQKYALFWQNFKWKAYERKTVLPRAFLADNYLVEKDPGKILAAIYRPGANLRSTLILEEEPGLVPSEGGAASVKIIKYQPDKVVIETRADKPKLLFLSDTYFPGWQAMIDGRGTKIYRADYAFRAVPVPAGKHTVEFNYDPQSFRYGGLLTALGLLVIVGGILWEIFRQKRSRLNK